MAGGQTANATESTTERIDDSVTEEPLLYFLLVGFLSWALPTVNYAFSSRPLGASTNAFGAACLLLLALAWRAHKISYRFALHAALSTSLLTLFAESFLIGQGDSQSTWYLVAIALAAGYLCRDGEIVLWAALTSLTQIAIRYIESQYPMTPEYVVANWELTVGQVLLTCMCAGFAVLSRRTADERLRLVLMREQYIRDQSKQLEEARDQAVAATAAKSRFLSTMSHEIRTPLYGILGSAQAIEVNKLGPDEAERVTTIQQSGELLLAVLNDILDSAKLEAGELSLHQRGFHLGQNLDAACRLVRPLTEQKGLSLVLDIPSNLPTHWLGDEIRIRQIVLNLLNNACKFSAAGTIRLRAAGENGSLQLEVSDQGIGIDEADQAHLFQPFHQIGEGDARLHGGSGLGLSIVRRLVDMMGGRIELRSQLGQGSVFTVQLPLVATRQAPAQTPEPEESPAKTLRVLVVDDNALNRKVTLNLLKRLKHNAEAVESAREGLAAVLDQKYDVILMDLQMPEMDGITATQEIRGLSEITQPSIIAFSADVEAGKKLAFGPTAFNAFLGKPLRLQQLADCLASVTPDSSNPTRPEPR